MKLVIAEKPSVAQSLAAVLGAKERGQGYLQCAPARIGLSQQRLHGNWRYHFIASHLSCTCSTGSQYQTGVKLHGVFPSWRG